jgi:hypothetical protein
VLHLHSQVLDLPAYLLQLEREMEQREAEWLGEIQALRRQLAQNSTWRKQPGR